ncbi:MAG: RNA polymerase sigma factor [Clostridiales bacterium]|nr:RNA polymerase sigma factor [Clostridiales bacterium]
MDRIKETTHDDLWILLEKAKDGDRDAFKTVVRLYQQKVFQMAYSFLRNREDALDIVQETFMRLYQKFDTVDTEGNFQVWLLQIAKNLSIDYYRKHYSRRREMEVEKSVDELDPASGAAASPGLNSDLRQAFSRCLDKLGERQRLVFVMKHYNGLHYKEIAEILDISIGTVKSLHFKAVQNMKKLLSPQLGMQP